jgi:hypothetical protein
MELLPWPPAGAPGRAAAAAHRPTKWRTWSSCCRCSPVRTWWSWPTARHHGQRQGPGPHLVELLPWPLAGAPGRAGGVAAVATGWRTWSSWPASRHQGERQGPGLHLVEMLTLVTMQTYAWCRTEGQAISEGLDYVVQKILNNPDGCHPTGWRAGAQRAA